MVNDSWELLWDQAMIALDSLKPGFKAGVPWSFGGGTAMRLFYDHRFSKDIDIFVTDPSVISGLSPRLNGTTERLTDTYIEQSNFLKLRFPEGEVEFIIAGQLIPTVPHERRTIRGHEADIERPIEVVAKKCFYRANDFTARDIFDLAVLLSEEPNVVEEHRDILLAKQDELVRRFTFIRAPAEAEQSIRERAAKARDIVQNQINGIAATPAFELGEAVSHRHRPRLHRPGPDRKNRSALSTQTTTPRTPVPKPPSRQRASQPGTASSNEIGAAGQARAASRRGR